MERVESKWSNPKSGIRKCKFCQYQDFERPNCEEKRKQEESVKDKFIAGKVTDNDVKK